MNGNNSILPLIIFLLIYLIDYILSQNLINETDRRSILDLKIKGNDFQKIMGSKPFPDLIYLNGIMTFIDDLGRIFIEGEKKNEINKVTLIWNQKINTCENNWYNRNGFI